MDTVTIPREEYERLKELARQNTARERVERVIEDLEAGRISEA